MRLIIKRPGDLWRNVAFWDRRSGSANLMMGTSALDRPLKLAAIAYTQIKIANLNGDDQQARLTDILNRIAGTKGNQIDEALLWRNALFSRVSPVRVRPHLKTNSRDGEIAFEDI